MYLEKNKLDCIEMLISRSVEDGVIDHNEFLAIMNEKDSMIIKKNKKTVNVSNNMKSKYGRLQMRSLCSVCGNKKNKFVKKQEAKGILSSIGIRTPLSKIPGLNILF